VTCRLDTAEEVSIYEAGACCSASRKTSSNGNRGRHPFPEREKGDVPFRDTMAASPQIRIPATYMRGGTSKGVFFRLQDLPERCQVPGEARDRLFLRVIGSPDPYAAHIDGMGGATSSTSKCVILSKSTGPTTTSTTCTGRFRSTRPSSTGAATAATCRRPRVRSRSTPASSIRRASAGRHLRAAHLAGQHRKTIVAHVPVAGGQVQETGDFELDGVTFPAAEIVLEFIDPAAEADASGGAMFPTGNLVDDLEVPGVGTLKTTLITAGIPTVFVNAGEIAARHRAARGHQHRRKGTREIREDPRRRRAAHGLIRTPEKRRSASTRPRLRTSRARGLRRFQRQADRGE